MIKKREDFLAEHEMATMDKEVLDELMNSRYGPEYILYNADYDILSNPRYRGFLEFRTHYMDLAADH